MMRTCSKKIFESIPCFTKRFIKTLLKIGDLITKIGCFGRMKELVDEFRNKIIPSEIDQGGSFSSQIRAAPSRENGKSISLIDVFGAFENFKDKRVPFEPEGILKLPQNSKLENAIEKMASPIDSAIVALMKKEIEGNQDNALSLCTEKVLLARQAYDLIDSHVKRLDEDLHNFAEDLKQEGKLPADEPAAVK
nr:PHD finger protein ING2 [Tanacetum cinerariifolium]